LNINKFYPPPLILAILYSKSLETYVATNKAMGASPMATLLVAAIF